MGGEYDPSGNVSDVPVVKNQSLMPGQGTVRTIPGIGTEIKQHHVAALAIGASYAAYSGATGCLGTSIGLGTGAMATAGGAVAGVGIFAGVIIVGAATAAVGGVVGYNLGQSFANALGWHPPGPGKEPATKDHPIWHKSPWGILAGLAAGIVAAAAVGLAVAAVVGTGGMAAPLIIAAAAGLAGGGAGGFVMGMLSQCGSTAGHILEGSPNVSFENKAVARVTDPVQCDQCGGQHVLAQGSRTISVNGLPLARKGHKTDCDAIVEQGCKTISADMTTGTYMEIQSSNGVLVDTLVDVIGDIGIVLTGRLGRGEPVDVATGTYMSERTDFSWPGILPLELTRTYLPHKARRTPFGCRWASNWTQRLWFMQDGKEVLLEDDDGAGSHFSVDPDQPFDAHTRIRGQYHLTGNRTEAYLFDRQTQLTRVFSPVGPSDEFNVLTAIVDRNGNRNSFIYDKGLLIRVIASDGTVFEVESSAQGWITALRRKGETRDFLSYSYDTKGHLTETRSLSHGAFVYTYTNDGLLESWRDSGPTLLNIIYDKKRRVVATSMPEGLFNDRFVYFPGERKVQYIDATGACETIWYNKDNLQTRSENAEGQTTLFAWDERQNLVSQTDALGRVTRYGYNAHNEMIWSEDWAGRRTTWSYTEFGQLTKATFPDGVTLQWEYDERGNLISGTDAAGATTRYAYDTRGRVTEITDPLGATTHYHYDEAGWLASIVDPAGAATRLSHDAYGRVVHHVDAEDNITKYEYQPSPTNPREQLSHIIRADGGTEQFAYDQEGLLTRYQGASGQDNQRQYGAFDLLLSTTDAAGGVTRFGYDGTTRLTSVVNAAGQNWTYDYDGAGRLIAERDFAGRVTRYQRDALGRLVVRTRPDGEEHHVEWDERDNIVAITTPNQAIRYKYDDKDRLIHAATERNGEPETVLLLFYDKAGRLTREIQDGAEIDYRYDEAGRVINRASASGATDWSYDPRGLLNEFLSNGHGLGFRHNGLGLETRREGIGGFALAQSYDPCGRLAVQHTGRPGAAGPLSGDTVARRYQWDKSGRLQGISDSVRGEKSYQYDQRDQVVSTDRTRKGRAKESERYNYDLLLNIAGSEAGAYAYDSAHEVTQAGPNSYRRDSRGRVTSRTVVENGFRPKTWSYEWDSFDRLIAVRTPDGSLWRYTYDAFGRRVRKECVTVGRESVTRFLWQGGRLAEELRGKTTTRWHYEPGSFRPMAKEVALTGAGGGGSRFYPIVTDHLGTPKEVFDEKGECQWRADQSLWGLTRFAWRKGRARVIDEASCPLRFPGQYEDEETGLFYNLNRYYDPAAAMYLSPDPIGLEGGIRPHGYVHDPLTWIDPLGLARYPSAKGKVAREAKWPRLPREYEGNPGVQNHFRKHGIGMGYKSAREYNAAARQNIRDADHVFSYRDKFTGEPRVGYFDSKTGLFTATDQSGGTPIINTFFKPGLTWQEFRSSLNNFSTIRQ